MVVDILFSALLAGLIVVGSYVLMPSRPSVSPSKVTNDIRGMRQLFSDARVQLEKKDGSIRQPAE